MIFLTLLKYWKVGVAILAIVAITGMAVHIYESGKLAGIQAQQRSQIEDDKKQLLAVVSANTQAIAAYQTQLAQYDAKLQESSVRLDRLEGQRQAASNTVSHLPDSAVQKDLETKAGGLISDPVILRKIDDTYTQFPLLQNELDEVLKVTIPVLNQKITALEGEVTSLVGTINTILPAYKRAYDAAQKRHSLFIKIITLGLVHDRHLDLPDPLSLAPKPPDTAAPAVPKVN